MHVFCYKSINIFVFFEKNFSDLLKIIKSFVKKNAFLHLLEVVGEKSKIILQFSLQPAFFCIFLRDIKIIMFIKYEKNETKKYHFRHRKIP